MATQVITTQHVLPQDPSRSNISKKVGHTLNRSLSPVTMMRWQWQQHLMNPLHHHHLHHHRRALTQRPTLNQVTRKTAPKLAQSEQLHVYGQRQTRARAEQRILRNGRDKKRLIAQGLDALEIRENELFVTKKTVIMSVEMVGHHPHTGLGKRLAMSRPRTVTQNLMEPRRS